MSDEFGCRKNTTARVDPLRAMQPKHDESTLINRLIFGYKKFESINGSLIHLPYAELFE